MVKWLLGENHKGQQCICVKSVYLCQGGWCTRCQIYQDFKAGEKRCVTSTNTPVKTVATN